MTIAIKTKSVFRVTDLNVHYGLVHVVKNVSIDLQRGEAVAVIGSNGAGKTTMLRAIMGLIRCRASERSFLDQAIDKRAPFEISRLGIGYVPEGRELFGGLTVEEELLIGGRSLGKPQRAQKLEEVFHLFPRLKERTRQIARTMSGGEQQMLAIARVLMNSPTLLLLDEPSLGLAPVIQDTVYETLAMLKRQGLSILLVEQNAFRALNLCERAYVIELGNVVRAAPSQELLTDPAIKAAYLGS